LPSVDGWLWRIERREVHMLRGPEDEEQDEVMTEASEDSNEDSTEEEE
jgi:hypothetical protein